MQHERSACEEQHVASLYQDSAVAENYIQQRFAFSWGQLLHQKQVAEVNRIIRTYQPASILEVAPGPARLATELHGVRRGVMLEYSEEMITLAKRRLEMAGQASRWDIRHGNAFELEHLQDQFDLLYTFRFIRHFHAADRERLYRGMRACLNPGGVLMFDVVNRVMREKLEAQNTQKSPDELDVYDVTYSQGEFGREMAAHGFAVLSLRPVIQQFFLQRWVSCTFDHRIRSLSLAMVQVCEVLPSQHPLEWIAVCRKAA